MSFAALLPVILKKIMKRTASCQEAGEGPNKRSPPRSHYTAAAYKLSLHSVGVIHIQLLHMLPAGWAELNVDLQVSTTGSQGKAQPHLEMSDEVKEDYVVITVKAR